MTTSAGTNQDLKRGRGLLTLWVGLLAAPLAWLTKQEVNYLLVPWVCVTGHSIVFHLVALSMLLVAALGGWVAWRDWKELGSRVPSASEGGAVPRSQFMSLMGLMMSALFFLAILLSGIASFILNPCQW